LTCGARGTEFDAMSDGKLYDDDIAL